MKTLFTLESSDLAAALTNGGCLTEAIDITASKFLYQRTAGEFDGPLQGVYKVEFNETDEDGFRVVSKIYVEVDADSEAGFIAEF